MENNDSIFTGLETTVTLPDGNIVTIRETNGEDDAVISKTSNMSDGTNIHNFLAGIITKNKAKKFEDKTTTSDVASWPVNCIYYLVYKQRLINHGKELKFKTDCPNCNDGIEHEYEDDISGFDNEKTVDSNAGGTFAIKPYPQGLKRVIELTTSRGKTLKYKILTGELQKVQLDAPSDALNKNTKILIRDLEIYENGQWVKVKYFGNFSSKEMREIRENIEINDYSFDPIIIYKCPKCQNSFKKPLFAISSFYWPEEAM